MSKIQILSLLLAFSALSVGCETDDEVTPIDNMNDADNSRVNKRDREVEAITPMDQSGESQDIRITADIRKAIIADDTMSMNARNIKIVTMNGRTTLRGLVDTEDEKRMIEEIAVTVAGLSKVDNLLEVDVDIDDDVNPDLNPDVNRDMNPDLNGDVTPDVDREVNRDPNGNIVE